MRSCSPHTDMSNLSTVGLLSYTEPHQTAIPLGAFGDLFTSEPGDDVTGSDFKVNPRYIILM